MGVATAGAGVPITPCKASTEYKLAFGTSCSVRQIVHVSEVFLLNGATDDYLW